MARVEPDERCPGCDLKYDNFRTGFTFAEVKNMMWTNDEDREKWRNRRRPAVLGFWMELKQNMWTSHKGECDRPHGPMFETEHEEIPW